MSTGAQAEMDWAGVDGGPGGAGADGSGTGSGAVGTGSHAADARFLSDEEILGIEPGGLTASRSDAADSRTRLAGGAHATDANADAANRRAATNEQSAKNGNAANDRAANSRAGASAAGGAGDAGSAAEMPGWMLELAANPQVEAEARALWNEHQGFRAAFSSVDEARAVAEDARAIKEIFPGGVEEARALREGTESLKVAAQSIDRIDAAIFSGDVRAQSEVVTELARANPAAFRSLVAEATKVLATLPGGAPAALGHFSQMLETRPGTAGAARRELGADGPASQFSQHDSRELSRQPLEQTFQHVSQPNSQHVSQHGSQQLSRQPLEPDIRAGDAAVAQRDSRVADRRFGDRSDLAEVNGSRTEAHATQDSARGAAPQFDAAAYASFERGTNDLVGRDVRGSIGDTLARVLPEGIADGAAKRIGEDIFHEVHRGLAADRQLSEQVADVLRDRRFGSAEQSRVAALLVGRAKQLVPSVARRVIGEWTSSVLGTARSKAARQAAAASRVDIAAPGGSLDSMPLRGLSAREVNYASMSDDEILGM